MEINVTLDEKAWSELLDEKNKNEIPEHLLKEIRSCGKQSQPSLPLPLAIKLGRWCRRSPSKVALHRLLHGAAIDLPSLPEPKPDPELQERLVKLRQERDQLLYDRMVSNVSRKSASARNRRAPFTSGINFGITLVASVFVAVFILRGLVDGLMMRVAIGLAVGTVIMCIEIYLAVRAVEKDESTR